MLVHRCDVCKKKINRMQPDYLEIGRGWNPDIELCAVCAKPIVLSLTKQELLPKRLLKNLQSTAFGTNDY